MRLTRGNDSGVQAALQETLDQARTAMSDTIADAEEMIRDRTKRTERYVGKNPWKAVAIAAGIGFVLALLIRR